MVCLCDTVKRVMVYNRLHFQIKYVLKYGALINKIVFNLVYFILIHIYSYLKLKSLFVYLNPLISGSTGPIR